jgi:ABC-type transport system involved in cytochrome bd biosynthesis fused ATPase/permease subunit
VSNSPPFKKAFRFEIAKFIIIVFPIIAGGIVFAVFVPISEKLSWLEFLFFAIIGFLIILSQCVSFVFKRRRMKKMQDVQGLYSSKVTASVPSTFTSGKSSAPKEAIKIDEYAVAYCPTCGKSFTKKYTFCPNCGSCKIKGML